MADASEAQSPTRAPPGVDSGRKYAGTMISNGAARAQPNSDANTAAAVTWMMEANDRCMENLCSLGEFGGEVITQPPRGAARVARAAH
jgi:hypothetical protein